MDFKIFIKQCVFLMIFLVVGQFAVACFYYLNAVDTVNDAYSTLCRIVASDNCLDDTVKYNGKTNYDRFQEMLEDLEEEVGYVEFDNTSVDVEYTSRDTAPQQYTKIRTKLTGYYTFKIDAFGTANFRVPITRDFPVMGIKHYRDR